MCTFSVTFSAIPVFIIDFSREEADALTVKHDAVLPEVGGHSRGVSQSDP